MKTIKKISFHTKFETITGAIEAAQRSIPIIDPVNAKAWSSSLMNVPHLKHVVILNAYKIMLIIKIINDGMEVKHVFNEQINEMIIVVINSLFCGPPSSVWNEDALNITVFV